MAKETKYISDPEICSKTAGEFLQEFKEHVYPVYASFGITLAEALIIWKLNTIYNSLNNSEDDWETE